MANNPLPSTHRIDGRFEKDGAKVMLKFYALVAALAVFAPAALATLNQAAQIVS
jgi:hypothetical protein